MIFSILREEYLELVERACDRADNPLSNAYRFCAAKLIHLFEWQTKQGIERIQVTRVEIYNYLLGEHGKDAIAASINFLREALGILNFEQNKRVDNKRNGQNKTYFYEFNWNKVTELLSLLDNDSSNSSGDSSTYSSDCSPTIEDLPNTSAITFPTTTDSGVEKGAVPKEEEADEDITPDSSTPSSTAEERRTILEKLRSLNVKLDSAISGAIKKYFANCEGAIAALEEAIRENRCKNPHRYLLKALHEGWNPEKPACRESSFPKEQSPPSKEQYVLLDRKKANGEIYDYYLSDDGITKVVIQAPFGRALIPWYEFLNLTPQQT